MSWPVNWIEQAQYYLRLQARLDALKAQSQTVVVYSFRKPTQQMWEDAYVNQVSQVPPILPGVRLFWFDLKNGLPKRYATVTAADGLTIDPVVRPFVGNNQPRSCFRLLGTRQLFEVGQFNPANSPIRHKGFSLMYDLEMLVKKNLVTLIVMFRETSPVWISVMGDWNGVNPLGGFPEVTWGNPSAIQWWTLKREAALAAVGATGATTTDGFVQQTVNSTAIVSTESYFGYSLLFSPAAAYVTDEHQPFSAGLNFQTLVGALTAQVNPLHLWQSFGLKYDGSGLKELYFGTPAAYPLTADRAYIYGIFAGDPGPLEVFDV